MLDHHNVVWVFTLLDDFASLLSELRCSLEEDRVGLDHVVNLKVTFSSPHCVDL